MVSRSTVCSPDEVGVLPGIVANQHARYASDSQDVEGERDRRGRNRQTLRWVRLLGCADLILSHASELAYG